MNTLNNLKELLEIHQDNLQHLEMQKAQFTSLYLPAYVATQIEEEKREIERLTKEIQRLKQVERLKPELQPPFERLKPEIPQPNLQMQQNINVTGGQGVTINQVGGDYYGDVRPPRSEQIERLKPEIQEPELQVAEATTTTKDSSISIPSDLLGETEFIPLKGMAITPGQVKFDRNTEIQFGLEIDYEYINPILPALFHSYINLKVPAIKISLKNSSDASFTNIILSYEMQGIIEPTEEGIIDILKPQDSISKAVVMIAPKPEALFRYEGMDRNLSLKLKFKNQYGREHEWPTQLQVKISSKNSFTWDINGEDCSELIATFITPHDPAIREFLGEAREFSPNRQFFGYQKEGTEGRRAVFQQIKAIYETLVAKRVSYVSTSKDFTGTQAINFPSQTLADGYGNCADLSILFAAVCEAIKINPILIKLPRHIFFGFEVSRGTREYFLLETTFVGEHSFEQAIKQGREKFKKERDNLSIIDITKARDAGIFPIML